ncbi:MAG: tRNA uridine(34) 5-carboxymethylaminomethyl modification radical SAM/GNAT enzyme Elp3 [Patescibacteria group bacterium]
MVIHKNKSLSNSMGSPPVSPSLGGRSLSLPRDDIKKIIKCLITKNPQTEKDFLNLARHQFGKLKLPPPEKSKLLSAYHKIIKKQPKLKNRNLEKFLTKRAVRTLSGVAVISVLTKPHPCPGRCLFCPTESGMPKSYLSNEPAVMRAILNDFNPYRQVAMRLKALQANGHAVDKIELIVMGGTWSYHPRQYQNWFIKRCFDALNGRTSKDLATAQKRNETARHRCIGLTLETRPDFINEKEIVQMRSLGCTRVELGIQHTDDKILKLNRRGHSVKQSIEAIKLLKNSGFKINLHLMPNLYGSTPAKDLAMFKKIYTDGNYMPDMVKIYPCVVNKDARLYRLWQTKKYRPYSDRQLLDLLIKIKKITPPWVRITRLIRDIPEESIAAGNKITNLRQLINEQAEKDGWNCKCIRCREVGHVKNLRLKDEKTKLKIRKYRASGGQEYFLSFESPDEKILYAFLRLRINNDSEKNFIPELHAAALIRELHTYGQLAGLGKKGEVQHLGLGKKLLLEAEKITKKGLKKTCPKHSRGIAVIAGIGVREYYKKMGYTLSGTYMLKSI